MKKNRIVSALLLLSLLMSTLILSACGGEGGGKESLEFISNGDGTCYVSGIGTYKDTVNVIIPETSPEGDTVTGIGYGAFADIGDTLTTISIPDTITSIDDNAFAYCENLTYNVYEDVKYLGNEQNPYMVLIKPTSRDEETYTIHPDTKFLYTNAFWLCENLTNITIPGKVISIGMDAFSQCTQLKELIIPEGVTTLGKDAFYACRALTKLSVPNSLTSIGDDTFAWLTMIEETEYNGMYYIGNDDNPYVVLMWAKGDIAPNCALHPNTKFVFDGAFFGCNLTSVVIPKSMIYIGEGAFDENNNLTDVYYTGTEAEWGAIKFDRDNRHVKNATIHYNYGN